MALPSILQDAPGLGEQFGTGLGQGIGGTLQQLANMKLNQFAQRQQAAQTAKAFQQLPGITPEIAQFLGALSPEERKYPLQNLGALMQLGAAQQGQSPMAASQMQPQSGIEALQGLNASHLLSNPNQVNPLIKQALSKAPLQPQSPGKEQLSVAPVGQSSSEKDQAQLISDIFTSPQEKRERHKLALKEKQVAQQEKAERFKATKELRKDISDRVRGAKQDLRDFDRMEENEKYLDTPGYVEFLKNAGLDIPALMNPESVEFQKIALGQMRNLKQYFGNRILQIDVENFLKTIPSLSMSPEGRKRIIANLRYLRRGELAYGEAMKEIIKENDGVPPYDLAEQIDDRIDSKMDKLADKFKEDLAKPVPEAQNRMVTALQSIAGSALGGVGHALKGLVSNVGGLGGTIGTLKALKATGVL